MIKKHKLVVKIVEFIYQFWGLEEDTKGIHD